MRSVSLTSALFLVLGFGLTLACESEGSDDLGSSSESAKGDKSPADDEAKDEALPANPGSKDPAGSNSAGPANSSAPSVDCPVILLCQICADGSCAEPKIDVVDGKCGETQWLCSGVGPNPPASTDTTPVAPGATSSQPAAPDTAADCAAPALCKLCADNSCAAPVFSHEGGSCKLVEWKCGG